MLAFSLFRRKKSLQSVSKHTVSSSFISRITKQPKIFKISAVSLYLAPWRGLEPPVYRLGGGCVIHYATRAYSLVSIRISIFSGCSIPRLGGGCSILLSYGDVCLIILSKNNPIVKWESKSETRRIWQKITEKHTHDLLTTAYTVQSVLGGKHMENKDATQLDIDDLIFDQEDGGASQR